MHKLRSGLSEQIWRGSLRALFLVRAARAGGNVQASEEPPSTALFMTPRCPKAVWIDRFIMEFARRAPDAPPADVEMVAANVYEEAHDMEPEDAVEAYVGFFHG